MAKVLTQAEKTNLQLQIDGEKDKNRKDQMVAYQQECLRFESEVEEKRQREEAERRERERQRVEEEERRREETAEREKNEKVREVIEALEVIGYDPTAALNFAETLPGDLRISIAVIAFFLGRITKKKKDVRPLLEKLDTNGNGKVISWIDKNFAGGKTMSAEANDGKTVNFNFSQVASSCLIIEAKTLQTNRAFISAYESSFANSSVLAIGESGVNMWSYESTAYLPVSDDVFSMTIGHMYWRMATTAGYIAPVISVSLKIRKFVSRYHRTESKSTLMTIDSAYSKICVLAKTNPIVPLTVLRAIVESTNGKRNDDLNVTSEKNSALRSLAENARKAIKAAGGAKSQKKKSDEAIEGE